MRLTGEDGAQGLRARGLLLGLAGAKRAYASLIRVQHYGVPAAELMTSDTRSPVSGLTASNRTADHDTLRPTRPHHKKSAEADTRKCLPSLHNAGSPAVGLSAAYLVAAVPVVRRNVGCAMTQPRTSDSGSLNPWQAGWRAHTVVLCWVVAAAAVAAAIFPGYPTGWAFIGIAVVVLGVAFALLIWLHR